MDNASDTHLTETAREKLRQTVSRIERLEMEKKEIADQIKDVYAEAKAMGYDTKALRQCVRLRKQDKAVTEQVFAAFSVDDAIVFQHIHPVRGGRDEDISRRALADLSRQSGGSRERQADIRSCCLAPRCCSLVQAAFQAGGGEDGVVGCCCGRREGEGGGEAQCGTSHFCASLHAGG